MVPFSRLGWSGFPRNGGDLVHLTCAEVHQDFRQPGVKHFMNERFKEPRPAMPFYGADFYSSPDVLMMGQAERGSYIHLTWLCWRYMHIPDGRENFSRLVGAEMSEESYIKIRACFQDAGDERLFHPKTETIRADFQRMSERRRAAGKAGAKGRWQKDSNGLAK